MVDPLKKKRNPAFLGPEFFGISPSHRGDGLDKLGEINRFRRRCGDNVSFRGDRGSSAAASWHPTNVGETLETWGAGKKVGRGLVE